MRVEQETEFGDVVYGEAVRQGVREILEEDISIEVGGSGSGQRSLSKPIQDAFENEGHETEVRPQALPNKQVDVYYDGIPMEIDIGSKRTAILTNLLTLQVEYEQGHVDGTILVVPENKEKWGGKSWFKTREYTEREIGKYRSVIDLPIWLIGVSP